MFCLNDWTYQDSSIIVNSVISISLAGMTSTYIDSLHIIGLYLYYLFTDTLDQVRLTSSISGRNACPSEEVNLTCTAQGEALFWRSEAFEEKAMHYMSAPSTGEFTAKFVSYDRNQSCLVSSLSFRATASRNGTTVTCTNRDRSSNQSFSLHIMSSEFFRHFLRCKYLLMYYLAHAQLTVCYFRFRWVNKSGACQFLFIILSQLSSTLSFHYLGN